MTYPYLIYGDNMADKIDAKRFGIAGGILYGAIFFAMTVLATATGYGKEMLSFWATWHPGYGISYAGSIVGLVYGFACGFIGLYALAWLYNKLER